jgi:hypothetical protein
LTIVDPTEAVVLLLKLTGGVVGMAPARAAKGNKAAPSAAYFHNFKEAAGDILKGSYGFGLLIQPGKFKGADGL